ncbi:LamG domain-containing protein [Geminicoccus flavidas]|uniref:LamG domain-containing protein n=1 Tax=Geminicoccus flavidas TaxID=2506407 RepID=UPI00135C21B8|nr:LamG domain-containing protein [Geminicoccus flavidas]
MPSMIDDHSVVLAQRKQRNACHVCAMKRLWRRLGMASSLAFSLMATTASSFAAVPKDGLVARYDFSGSARDLSGQGHHGTVHHARLTRDRFGRPRQAYFFNGSDAYVEVPDHDVFSLATTGQLSISVWMRPDTLEFISKEGTGYVHWLGKGEVGQHEWVFRMYSRNNTERRGNRTSFYLFNLAGGEGAGSFVQEQVTSGRWYHYVGVANRNTDTITWYKNGKQQDQDPFMNSQYHINPKNGTAPVRIGTRDFKSYFRGAIDDIRIYDRPLSAAEVMQLYHEMRRP